MCWWVYLILVPSFFLSKPTFVLTSFFFFVSSAFLDEAERKYLFECNSREQCVEWMDAIIKARFATFSFYLTLVVYCYNIFHTCFSCSYEFMRKNLIFYRSEIHRLTGKVKDKSLMLSDPIDSLNTLQSMSSFPSRSSLTSNLILIKIVIIVLMYIMPFMKVTLLNPVWCCYW